MDRIRPSNWLPLLGHAAAIKFAFYKKGDLRAELRLGEKCYRVHDAQLIGDNKNTPLQKITCAFEQEIPQYRIFGGNRRAPLLAHCTLTAEREHDQWRITLQGNGAPEMRCLTEEISFGLPGKWKLTGMTIQTPHQTATHSLSVDGSGHQSSYKLSWTERTETPAQTPAANTAAAR